jgi:hypothetical protein
LVIIGRPELEVTIHYVRYWQILEALAESRNYNPDTPLVDYTGGAMTPHELPQFFQAVALAAVCGRLLWPLLINCSLL